MQVEKKLVKRAKKGKPIRQVAAVPARLDATGAPQILLITSRGTGRFIVPKGWPMKGKSGRKAAVIEAEQEAGVTGTALSEPIGWYSYWKRLSKAFVRVDVTVYLLLAGDDAKGWKESRRRSRAWLSLEDAATLIDDPELATVLRQPTLAGLVQDGFAQIAQATA